MILLQELPSEMQSVGYDKDDQPPTNFHWNSAGCAASMPNQTLRSKNRIHSEIMSLKTKLMNCTPLQILIDIELNQIRMYFKS